MGARSHTYARGMLNQTNQVRDYHAFKAYPRLGAASTCKPWGTCLYPGRHAQWGMRLEPSTFNKTGPNVGRSLSGLQFSWNLLVRKVSGET